MTHEEIIQMAREAGEYLTPVSEKDFAELQRFATLVAAAEREACAVDVEKEPSTVGIIFAVEQAIRNGDCPWEIEAAFDAYEADRKAIRARNNTSNSIKE
jgi:hypothetical protein